jgi:hypothetical protein
MAPLSHREEYHELMKHNGDGHYLYTPQKFSHLHPGSVGYFNKYGVWNQITDLSEGGKKDARFTPFGPTLTLDEPSESMWKTVSSGSEAESSFGLTGGLSGALSAAPVDVSANAKNKSGSTGKAALITTGVVKNERLLDSFGPSLAAWVKENAKALVASEFGDYIKDYGLWAIHTTWSTPECAIKLKSGYNSDTSAGMDVGGTGVGKIGASGSSLKKLESEGWRTYEAKEVIHNPFPGQTSNSNFIQGDSFVVSYGGAGFKLHTIQMFRSNVCPSSGAIRQQTNECQPLKQTEKQAAESDVFLKRILDENGNQIGLEEYRSIYDETGKVIGEKKVDEEAEKKKREEEEKKAKEDVPEFEEEFVIECEPDGMSASDLAADDNNSAEVITSTTYIHETPEEKERQKELMRKMTEIRKIPDEEQRQAELAKLAEAFKEHRL